MKTERKFTVITAIARLASIAKQMDIMSLGMVNLEFKPEGYKLFGDDLADIADLFADLFEAVPVTNTKNKESHEQDNAASVQP